MYEREHHIWQRMWRMPRFVQRTIRTVRRFRVRQSTTASPAFGIAVAGASLACCAGDAIAERVPKSPIVVWRRIAEATTAGEAAVAAVEAIDASACAETAAAF